MSSNETTEFDFDFRPAGYFEESVETLANIMGEWRREYIREALDKGEGGLIPAEMFASVLSGEVRGALGKIHPRLMGGEYLPPPLEGEVEIARVSMASTTADVISIRARPEPGGIVYRVVDEYDASTGDEYEITPRRSTKVLSFGELVKLIQTADIGSEVWGQEWGARGIMGPLYFGIWEQGEGLGEMWEFVHVSSEFYPELRECFDGLASDWVETFEKVGPQPSGY